MSEPTIYLDGRVSVHAGDCLATVKSLADNSIDACVTDPPYALISIVKRFGKTALADETGTSDRSRNGADGYARLAKGFMGKVWDNGSTAFSVDFWAEVFRVLKPGAHVVAFGGTRSYHRLACAIEDAGFEIRDQLAWCYGTGFPKSHDVSKGIDKAAGVQREIVASRAAHDMRGGNLMERSQGIGKSTMEYAITKPATDEASAWEGWGTALKPAWEPVVFGSKPVTVAQHFAMVVEEITAILFEAAKWLNLNASDVAPIFRGIQAKCGEVANSVLANARMRSLESIGIAKSAARGSTFNGLASIDLIRTRDCSVLSHVAPNGRRGAISEQTTELGRAADILSRLLGISTSAMVEGISENTVKSWAIISDDLLNVANKFTIETVSKLTIALRTLNCSLLPIISEDTGRLTPSWEPICLARKPLSEPTVAANVLKWRTGAINIGACRVEGTVESNPLVRNAAGAGYGLGDQGATGIARVSNGRWPANVVIDDSQEVRDAFPETGLSSGGGGLKTSAGLPNTSASGHFYEGNVGFNDSGSAARFFYSSKADADDRLGSKHPTVKPLNLMCWLVKLITPPGGTVLDPFAGTGTTGEAAWREGFNAVLIEREEEYLADIARRMKLCLAGPDERARESIKARNAGKPDDHGPLFGGTEYAGGADRYTGNSPIKSDDRTDGAQMVRTVE